MRSIPAGLAAFSDLLDGIPAWALPLPPVRCAACGEELAARVLRAAPGMGRSLCGRCAHPAYARACAKGVAA